MGIDSNEPFHIGFSISPTEKWRSDGLVGVSRGFGGLPEAEKICGVDLSKSFERSIKQANCGSFDEEHSFQDIERSRNIAVDY
jgi:hypothetical protein